MSGRDGESLNGSAWSGGDIGSEAQHQRRHEGVAGTGRAATQGALVGHKQSLGKVESRPCPVPPPTRNVQSASLCVSGTARPGLVRPGVPNLSEATCTLNHQLRALSSRIAGTTRSGPTSALPRPFWGAAQLGLGKLVEGFPWQDTHWSAGSWVGWGGDPGLGSFPDPGGEKKGRNAGRIPGVQGRTCRQ